MTIVKWGAIGALIFVSAWLAATVLGTPMPDGFRRMTPVALTGVGFFWGMVIYTARERLGGRHG